MSFPSYHIFNYKSQKGFEAGTKPKNPTKDTNQEADKVFKTLFVAFKN